MCYLPRRERLATCRLAVTRADSVKSCRSTFTSEFFFAGIVFLIDGVPQQMAL